MAAGWYEPDRVTLLHQRVEVAVLALARIRSDDLAAVEAVRAVRRAEATLTERWLPLLRELGALTALTVWDVGAALPEGGRSLAIALAGSDDEEVVTDLRAAIAASHDDQTGRAGVEAWATLVLHLAAVAARLDTDPGRASLIWRELGPSGTAQLVDVLRAATVTAERGDLDGIDPQVARSAVLPSLGRVLAALAAHDADARGLVVTLSSPPGAPSAATTLVLDAIAHDPSAHTAALVRTVAAVQLHRLDQAASLGVADTEALAATCAVLLRHLAALPGLMPRLLAREPDVLRFLATTGRIDGDVVEIAIASGVGEASADGATVLAHLVAMADDTGWSTPALTGTARGVGVHLAELAEALPEPDRTVRLAHGSTTTPIGSFATVVALLGQVIDHEDPQRALGTTMREFVRERVADGSDAAVAAQRPGATPAESRRAMARELGALTPAIGLVDLAITHQSGVHERALATSRADHKRFFDVTTIGAGLVGGQVLGVGTRVLSVVVARLTGDDPPRSIPDTGARAAIRGAVDVDLLAAPVDDPSLRSALGLDGVPDATWQTVADHLDALRAPIDPDEADARWDALVDAIEGTELAAYLFDVTTDSGIVTTDRAAG